MTHPLHSLSADASASQAASRALVERAATTRKKTKKKTKKRKKKVPVCTAKDLRTPKKRRRKCTVPPKKVPGKTLPSPSGPAAAAPITTPGTGAWTPSPIEPTDGLRTYRGPFGKEQATRLLFRAGFGPLPGQAEAFAAMGVERAVEHLMNPPGGARMEGPAPRGDFLVGGELAPEDRWGHGHLEWLDRMVRSTDQLGERMALILHDWIPISADAVERYYVRSYISLLRDGWRGSFRQLMLDLTIHPAMLLWLSGLGSEKWSPNENYAREIQELFCLGADRGAYTEADVREFARAFTGWDADWIEGVGLRNFRFDPDRWDDGEKVVYAGTPYERRGALDWRDAVNIVVDHPMHPSYVALRLWSAFIPTAPSPVTLAQLEQLYRSSGERLEPLVRAILLHPDLYGGPAVTKSPVTLVAGMLRGRGTGLVTDAWTWLCGEAGQMLWHPPNVSGWNERAWLNTTSFKARWDAAGMCVWDADLPDGAYEGKSESPEEAVAAALAFWGDPAITTTHRAAMLGLASRASAADYWDDEALTLAMRQRTLRQLVAAAPDYQVS